jgi:lipopolysaccharide/colanic/teichoic acid biosynthesis glycosyltransferase
MYIKYFKVIAEFIFCFMLLTVLSPIMLLSFIIIKLEDPSGGVLFRQQRIGRNGKPFSVLKLRSMKVSTNDKNGLELSDQQRMLKFGLLFRKWSIDELPQLFNILKGDMSLIGPRPLPTLYLPYFNKRENGRHSVKPGISGWAQVNGRNSISWEEKFELDIEYVENRSFLFDFKIGVMTILNVLSKSDIVVRGDDNNVDFHTYRMNQRNDPK